MQIMKSKIRNIKEYIIFHHHKKATNIFVVDINIKIITMQQIVVDKEYTYIFNFQIRNSLSFLY